MFNVVRYLRPDMKPSIAPNGDLLDCCTSNLGGITFLFEGIHTENGATIVSYAYAQCKEDENFSKTEGRTQALENKAKGAEIEIYNYNSEDSLVINVLNDLYAKSEAKDPIYLNKKLFRLRIAMEKIAKTQIYTSDFLDQINATLENAQ